MSVILAGQEFDRVGLQNCGINSSLPVGTVLQIPFLVWDNGRPPLKATANRTLVITSPCTSGMLNPPPPPPPHPPPPQLALLALTGL